MNEAIINELREQLGPDRVSTSDEVLASRRYDYWVLSHLKTWRKEDLPNPGVVVQPRTVEEVQKAVVVAGRLKVPIVPFGLGSGVCGGIEAAPERMILDLSSMNRIREIDETNLIADFDAGLNGLEAEEAVAERGLTIGHWPQSIAISTVGGWVSTRAAGQFSTAYGCIEDIVYSIEVVLPNGDLVVLGKAPRAAAGPDLRHLLMGAEGTMGVVTGVRLALRRQPETRAFSVFHCATLAAGFEAQREIVQNDWLPPVMRQYDAAEARRNFRDHHKEDHGVLLMVHEGPKTRVDAELSAVERIATNAGLERAPDEVGSHWMEHRNHVPSWQDLFEKNLIADTIEISANWTHIEAIYRDAVQSLQEIDGIFVASAHSSHVYRTGLNLYFTFVANHEDPKDLEATYLEAWDRVMVATERHGGGIAHHHGAGRLRKNYLVHDLGPNGVSLLRRLKVAMDPDAIMNPGNLLPDA